LVVTVAVLLAQHLPWAGEQ